MMAALPGGLPLARQERTGVTVRSPRVGYGCGNPECLAADGRVSREYQGGDSKNHAQRGRCPEDGPERPLAESSSTRTVICRRVVKDFHHDRFTSGGATIVPGHYDASEDQSRTERAASNDRGGCLAVISPGFHPFEFTFLDAE